MKIAVVYFSLEGNTKYVAEKIAKVMDADMIQLVPVTNIQRVKSASSFGVG